MRQKLTAKSVEYLRAEGQKRIEVWDATLPGFGIRVSRSGKKVWFAVRRSGGRGRRITIGKYPALSLADARLRAQKIFSDPDLPIAEDTASSTPKLSEALTLFVDLYARPKNRSWWRVRSYMSVFQPLFDMPLHQIKRSYVVGILDAVVARGKPYAANRSLSTIKKLMNWALDRGMIAQNPIAGLSPPGIERSRDRILSEKEIQALYEAAIAEGYPFGHIVTLLLLTGQRRGEVTCMRWSEVDFERRTWCIPASRSKNKKAHEVPLSPAAMELLNSIPRFLNSDLVFTTTGTSQVSGFGRAKDRFEAAVGSNDWRLHDLRRTVASGMARMGVQPHVVEKILNHQSGIISGVAAVYNRYAYETEKREALIRWAAWLSSFARETAAESDRHVSNAPFSAVACQ